MRGAEIALQVVGALEAVVRRCFGPEGGHVLFTRDTGETLITRDGLRILTSLRLDHPIARMVVECVSAHCCVSADGSKSFILLLAALLRGIHKECWEHATTRRLANQLLAFCWEELDDVIAHHVVPHTSSLFHSDPHGNTVEGGVLRRLVGGFIRGRVGIGQADILTCLICKFYHKWSCGRDAAQPITFIHTHFPLLHIPVMGLPIGRSQVLEGLVLSRDWSVWCEREGPVRVLVVCESLQPPLVVAGDALIVQRGGQLQDWLRQTECRLDGTLADLMRLQVGALLSSVKQSDQVLERARQSQLSVLECVDADQLDLFCRLSGAQPLTQPVHTRSRTLAHPLQGRVAMVTFCKRVLLGAHRYAHLGLCQDGTLHTHTLVLCAPAPGPLDQSVCVCHGVFKMLQHVCEPVFRTHTHPHPHPHTLGNGTDQTNSNSICQTHSTPPAPDQSESSPAPDQSQRTPPAPDQSKSSPAPDQSQRTPAPDQWDCVVEAGSVLPVGGVFELLLHHFLCPPCSADSEIHRLLAKALLSVPRTLHSHAPRRFLQLQAHFLSNLRRREAVCPQSGVQRLEEGLDCGRGSKAGVDVGMRALELGLDVSRLNLEEGLGVGGQSLESVSCKQRLLLSVVQCVSRLVCVESLLHSSPLYRTLSQPRQEEDEEEED